ncbi:DUF1661 domain-containing protein [Porphyromonas gingivalis]
MFGTTAKKFSRHIFRKHAPMTCTEKS